MKRHLLASLLAATAAFVALAPSGVDAADAVDDGWWWRAQTGQGATLPPPPGVPEGALFVQGAPDGAQAVAAVRFQLGEAETAPVLSMRFGDDASGDSAATAVVLACPAATAWRSGTAQPWGEKPLPECAQQAIGAVTDDGTAMVFDLSSFAVGPVVDVVLVPGTAEGLPDGLNGSSFSIVFAAPADTDLVTQAAGAPVTAPPTTETRGAATPTPASSSPPPSRSAASPPRSAPPAPRSTPPPTPSFRPPANPAAPALAPSEVAGPPAATSSGAPVPAFAPADGSDPGPTRALAVVLLLLATAGVLLAGKREGLLRLLGAVPTGGDLAATAGIGRFAAERSGAPPSLR